MKLSRFPNLVQKEIFDNMETSNLLLLSFVSRNMKNCIKWSQVTRFKSIDRIVFDMQNLHHPTIYIQFGFSKDVIMLSSFISEGLKIGYSQLNVSGKIIDFKCIPLSYGSRCPTRFPMIAFNQCDKQSIFESIHNYLLDFFGDTIEYEWIITDFQFFVPRVQHLSLVLNFRNTGTDEENIERLENIISLSPIMKHVQTTYWRPPGTLKPESKLYQAESISIVQDVPTILVNLGCFQGKQASFRCHSCRIFDLIEFVNRWKSGEAFQNLEHLEIILNHTDFPLNGVLNAIGVKYIDLVKTPPTHTLPKVYFESGHKPNTDPINSHTYVEKETDNRVASMSIEGTTFSFGVWNKTEEEFLALVK